MKLGQYDEQDAPGIRRNAHPATKNHVGKANEMVELMDNKEEEWKEKYQQRAWALAHSQLEHEEQPLTIFVVHKDLTDPKENPINARFPSRTIFNPVILSTKVVSTKTKTIMKTVLNPTTNRRELREVTETYEIPNTITSKEGCMSFANRKPKNVERFFRIKVRYWYPVTILGFTFLWRRTEWCEGLKSFIFQHEIDHMSGNDVYHGKQTSKV